MTAPPLKIGILGAARIAPPALVAPARATGLAEVVAVAARDRARAQAFAETHGVGAALSDYEALIDHPEVEAVYNALPPVRHMDLTLRALAAGKPVLCEKPFCKTAVEAQQMVDAAGAAGLVLMEAFHYRYHPLFARVLEVVRGGEIGVVRKIEAIFQGDIPDRPDEIRHNDALGGGALMDLGTYPVHWCRTIVGEEPRVVSASTTLSAKGVDLDTVATLAFPSGVQAEISCSLQAKRTASLVVEGERGVLSVFNPIAPQLGHKLEVALAGQAPREETLTREPTYDFQLRAFVSAVRGGPAPPTSGADSVNQMRILDEIRRMSRERAAA